MLLIYPHNCHLANLSAQLVPKATLSDLRLNVRGLKDMQVAKELTTTQEVIVEQASFARPLSEMTQQLLRLRMIPPLPERVIFRSRLFFFSSSAHMIPSTASSALALLPCHPIRNICIAFSQPKFL